MICSLYMHCYNRYMLHSRYIPFAYLPTLECICQTDTSIYRYILFMYLLGFYDTLPIKSSGQLTIKDN